MKTHTRSQTSWFLFLAVSPAIAAFVAPCASAFQIGFSPGDMPKASFVVLDAIPVSGENLCGATSISDDGRLVGGYSRSDRTADGRVAALWSGGVDATEVSGFRTENLWAHVRAFSANGKWVVGSATSGNEEQPFVWARDQGTQQLPVPLEFDGGEALAVNEDGSVVVGYGNYVGALWNRPVHLTEAMMWVSGQPQSLGFIGTGVWSKAHDVSANGSVVVGEAHLNTSVGEYVAVRWEQGVGPIEIGDLAGGYKRSRAVAVSADGQAIAGWGSKEFNPYKHRMFRWTSSGGLVDLGVAPGHQSAEATAMSADGKVIVGWGQVAGPANRIPVVWDATNGLRDLVSILESAGLNLSDWQDSSGMIFMQATGVAADGKTVVGFGNLNNSRRAWIMTLP